MFDTLKIKAKKVYEDHEVDIKAYAAMGGLVVVGGICGFLLGHMNGFDEGWEIGWKKGSNKAAKDLSERMDTTLYRDAAGKLVAASFCELKEPKYNKDGSIIINWTRRLVKVMDMDNFIEEVSKND